jgi:transcriptional regulator with XRE-family HTH domain
VRFFYVSICDKVPSFAALSVLPDLQSTETANGLCAQIHMNTPVHTELRQLRRSSGLTQDDVASILGVGGRSYVAMLESGDRLPQGRDSILLSLLFGQNSDSLFPHHYSDLKSRFIINLRSVIERAIKEGDDPKGERLSFLRDALSSAELESNSASI